MRKGCPTETSPACLPALVLTLSGSCVYLGSCDTKAHYEKQVSLSAPPEPGLSFSAETHDGSVTCKAVGGPTVTLRSSSGSIAVANVRASLQAETAYGPVTCADVSVDELKLKSNSGSIVLK